MRMDEKNQEYNKRGRSQKPNTFWKTKDCVLAVCLYVFSEKEDNLQFLATKDYYH